MSVDGPGVGDVPINAPVTIFTVNDLSGTDVVNFTPNFSTLDGHGKVDSSGLQPGLVQLRVV